MTAAVTDDVKQRDAGGSPLAHNLPDRSTRAAHSWKSLEGLGFPFVRAPAAGDLTATARSKELWASVSLMAVYTTPPHIDTGRAYRRESISKYRGSHFDAPAGPL